MGQRLCTEKKFKKIAREIEFPPSNISWSKGRENINMTFKTSNLQLSEQRIPQVFFAQLIVAANTKMYYLVLGRVCSERNVSQKMQKFSFAFCKLFSLFISHFFRVNEGNEKMRNFAKKFVKCERKLLHFLRNVYFTANPT